MRAAIVGCGGIAQVHAKVLSNLENVILVACADTKYERALALANLYGARAYDSLEEMLEKEQIDVLHICTPHCMHAPMAVQAAERGIHVFMEKPLAINREQLAQLSALGEQVRIGVCFQNRYNQNVKYVKGLIDSGRTGQIIGARAFVTWCRNKDYYENSDWRGRFTTEGGGALINQSIHTLDLVTEFLGSPSFVESHAANHHLKDNIEVEDTLEAYIDFHSCPAVFYATTAYSGNAPVLIELCCEHVTIRMEDMEISCQWKDGRKEHISFEQQAALGKNYWGSGHSAIIHDFYDCVETGRHFPIGISEAYTTMDLVFKIYESSRENRVIYF